MCYSAPEINQESPLPFDESTGFTAPSAFGPYRVLHQIGSGVLGPVFRTYDPQRERLVAVKAFRLDVVPEQVARVAESLRRLAASGLNHPGIVPVLDAGLENTTAYLATEYVAAETLDVALRHLAPAPLDRALPVLLQLADAIDAAWATGCGHGALHPRDIFVAVDTNDVRVTGFGVAQALEGIGIKAPVRRPYAAPERVAGGTWDARADVYSLGAIAHELLTRRRPAGSGEQDGALTTGTTPEQRVQIRRALSAALAERPEHRFASARAFIDVLGGIARGEAMAVLPEIDDPVEAPGDPLDAGEPAPTLESADVPLESPSAPSLLSEIDEEEREPTVADVTTLLVQPPVPPLVPPPAQTVELPPSIPVASTPWESAPVLAPVLASQRDVLVAPSPFPWSALGAVGVAGIVLGIVIGYQYARRTSVVEPIAVPAAVVRAGDTDVPVAPETVPPGSAPAPAPASKALAGDAPSARLTNPPSPKSEAPPVSQAAASAPGQIIVHSTPSGAMLVIDGRPRGQTPATVRDLAFGAHTVAVARPGYVPHTESLTLSARNAVRTLSIRLEPGRGEGAGTPTSGIGANASTTGSVFVDSRPQAARVMIDGRFVGTTPLRVPDMSVGSHAVRLELTGYTPLVTSIGVKAGEQARVTATLER